MGISLYVRGFRPPDEKWHQMKAVWDSCEAAGIEVPDEVDGFFCEEDEGKPDPQGITVELPVKEWRGSCGYELAVRDIPESVTHIRFSME